MGEEGKGKGGCGSSNPITHPETTTLPDEEIQYILNK